MADIYVNTPNLVQGPTPAVDSEIALYNGVTGSVIKRASGTGFVKVTSGVMGTPSSTINAATDISGQIPIVNLASEPTTHFRCIDGSRTDSYVEDGSYLRPFKTINAANAAATDAANLKRYVFLILPSDYVEVNTFKFKPYITYTGLNKEATRIKRSDNSAIVVDATVSCRSALSNLWILGALTMDRTGGSAVGANLDLLEVIIDSNFIFNGFGGGSDFLYARSVRFNGNVTVNAVETVINGSSVILGTATFGTTGGVTPDGFGSMAFADLEDTYIQTLVLNVENGHDGYYQMYRCTQGSSITATAAGTGTLEIAADAVSMPETRSNYVTSGTVSLDLGSRAHAVGYVPATSGDWASPVPANATDAIDRLAKAFCSTPQTGNGASQSIAHGLGYTPTKVLVSIQDDTAAIVSGTVITEGTHTSTNIVVTVTNGVKYKVMAF